ncbi:MAG: hypothetical protein FJ390_06115 [Verrucomicrobia bacterium]|nr:hypothetical protein [Verrucomicrobiota bacterium]
MSDSFFYLPERLVVRVTGNDRLRYLNGQVTNDLKRLVPGEAMQACLLTPKGKLSAVLWVTLQEDAILLEAPSELAEELPARLERYLVADDVMLEVISSEPTVHVFGELLNNPILEKISGILIPRLGLPGKDFKISELPDSFLKQHQALSEDEVEILRIEQRIPKWGAELTSDRLPPEAHLERQAIDYNKGCYVGQEVISRLRSVGHVNRLLVSLIAAEVGEALIPGMKLFLEEEPQKNIGFITSAVQESKSQNFIALGYVIRDYAISGKELIAGDGAMSCDVIVKS